MKFFNEFSISWLMLMLYLLLGTGESLSNYVSLSSYSLGTLKFNHLAIDNTNGNVFIGAVNKLYKLTADLTHLANATTNTFNKILIINYQGTELIACRSATVNLCEIYDVHTKGGHAALSSVNHKRLESITKNREDENISIVAFIANSHQNERNSESKLYAAVSYSDSFHYKTGITRRTLKLDRFISSQDYTKYIDARRINYVYGFNLGKYNYFLTTQRKHGAEGPQYISKLIRICNDVEYFWYGYIEIPIECKYGNESFNLVQAAHVGKPGSQLQKSLNIGPDDDVLFAVFSKSENMKATSNKPSNHSALCIYSLNTINEKFVKNIQHCFSGKGHRWLRFSEEEEMCQKENVNVDLDYCGGSDLNFPLIGDIPVTTSPVITFNNTLLTAITSKPGVNHNDVFIGTNTGHLKIVVVNNSVWEDADLVIDEGSPINPDLLFSPKKDYLYIMTEHDLTRIEIPIRLRSTSKVQKSLPMTTWRSTSTTSNIHSSTTKKIYRKCKDEDHNSSPTSNLFFSPLTGTREGGTILTITGKDLGYKSEHIRQIVVAGVACTPLKKECISTNSISCVIQKSNLIIVHEGPVEVDVSGTVIRSAQNFKFVDPKIKEFSPKQGPIYGGTELKIKGKYLNAGRSSEVYVGNSSCTMFSRNSTMIRCITNSSHVEQKAIISVKFDGNFHNSINSTFKYVKDPHRDEHGFNYKPKGILAGGVKIFIRNVSSLPVGLLLHIYDGKRIYNSSCEIHNITTKTWICLSPYFSDIASGSIDVKTPRKMSVSVLDNATNHKISVPNNQSYEFLLYPNPEFYYFINSSIEYGQNNFVVIVGRNINNACHKTDINVEVGNHSCEIMSISYNQVICRLSIFSTMDSEIDPERNHNILEEHDNVIVSIGYHFKVTVFKQNYPVEPENFLKKKIIYGLIIFVIVIILAIIFQFIYQRKTVIKHSEANRNMQQQISIMCMEAIAMKQCMKRVIIKNKITLDENLSNILKLPTVEIEITSLLRNSTGTSAESEYLLPVDGKWEFPNSNLTLGCSLGEGEFGKVLQGEAKGILKENITTIVAVKMLKDDHSDNDMIDLVSEMEIMKLIGTHVNVIRLLGCCTQEGPLFVITEYARHGNLREFLRKHLPSDKEITIINLSPDMLIMFAIQVAKGMEHLASIKCIHRDLAARNILVSENYILKIADFGLSRDITNKEYYKKRTDGRLPVKWMAPESLCHSIYSTQSDVWSYGILLWEIFTLGGTPYPSLVDLQKLYQILHSGYRMEKPPNCSVKTYSLMHKCWTFQPTDRPSFSTIVKNLQNSLPSHKVLDLCNVYWPEQSQNNQIENETEHLL